ncbi:hypothetical protein IHP72_15485 [Bacillus pumilus]|uniref:hypothetical protein n=1 Tax=Bacillus pumilus TaxID=1408 RepID=UPI001B39D617|nr:hypothetical protein [Bacillus pumilus]MBQ4817656.1 hypothetical protein [Bacillus pumilus]
MTKEELHEAITALYERTKAGAIEREERIGEIEALLATYDGTPPANALERLSDLILYEELSDTRRNKMTAEEYPIMSENQENRRKDDRHVRKRPEGAGREVPLSDASSVDIGGRSYKRPVRKIWSNKDVKSRNRKLRRRYNEFVSGKSSGQFTVNIATGIKSVRSDAQ